MNAYEVFSWAIQGINIVVLIGATWRLASLNTKFDYVVTDVLLKLDRRVERIEMALDQYREAGLFNTRSTDGGNTDAGS